MRFTLNNNGTYSGTYDGTVFHYGDDIPGYVSNTYTPKIWYDKSRSTTNGTWNIFEEMGIAESLILGEAEDDLWTHEAILDEICKFFNLHIVMVGYDFYIFDWETAKSDNSVEWVNLLSTTNPKETQQKTYSEIIVTPENYADDSTQISMGDCYNQIKLTDKVEKCEDVILSPFDDDNLYDIAARQKYMDEIYATGEGDKAYNSFKSMVGGATGTTYGDSDSGWKREWYFKVKGSKFWKFLLNCNDNYSQIPTDNNGKKYKQWLLAKYVEQTPWASGIFSFGAGERTNQKNVADVQNITSYTDYIVINVQGNGYDEHRGGTQYMYPNENSIENCDMKIMYVNANDGVYSSADSSITNYLIFSGNIHMTIAAPRTGSQGHGTYIMPLSYNDWTKRMNNGEFGANGYYVDDVVFKRRLNTFQNVKTMISNGTNFKYACVGSDDNDDGRYYTNVFYNQYYSNYSPTPSWSENFILPPECAEGDISKRFKYDLAGNKSYNGSTQTGWDTIPYIDVLACQLQIGDKYCSERIVNGHKVFDWLTEQELRAQNRWLVKSDGTLKIDAYIYLAIDINDGEYLIGQSHKIYNNISTDMNLDKTGMAIPLPSDEHLSGELRFSIVGVVNSCFGQGFYRHSTWFRHSAWDSSQLSIMPHVDKIFIGKFDVAFVSDNGNVVVNDDADIVYMSDETQKYVNRKDDIEFKFNSALTASEASAMGVTPVLGKSTVVNIGTGDAVVNVVNNVTNETDHPEKHYVDAYYREFCEPRLIVNTALKDNNLFDRFNKYKFPYFEGKTFFVVKTERDIKNESITLTLKEKNS